MNHSKILFALLVIFLAVYLVIFSFGKFHSNQNFHSENANSSESSHTNYLRWNLGVTPKEFAPLQRKFFDFMSRNQSCQAYSFVSYNDTADNSWPGDPLLVRYYNLIGDFNLTSFYINCSLNFLSSLNNSYMAKKYPAGAYLFVIRFVEFYPDLYLHNYLDKYPSLTSSDLLQRLSSQISYVNFNTNLSQIMSPSYVPVFRAESAISLDSLYLVTKNLSLENKARQLLLNLSPVLLSEPLQKDIYVKNVIFKGFAFHCFVTSDPEICNTSLTYADKLINNQGRDGRLCPRSNLTYFNNPPKSTVQALQGLKYLYLSNYLNSYEKKKIKASALKAINFTLHYEDNKNGGIVENSEYWQYLNKSNIHYLTLNDTLPEKRIFINYFFTDAFYTFYNSSNSQ